jgi:stage II sporulation protein Q
MKEQNKELQKEEALKTVEGAQGQASWKKLLAKKWVFPAVYMAAAAIILTLMWVYQGADNKSATGTDGGLTVSSSETTPGGNAAVPVTANAETMQWPVKDKSAVKTSLGFYDTGATDEEKAAAMVSFENTMQPHTGIDFSSPDNQPFDVAAASSGKVTIVEQNPVVGHIVEIESPNGLVTVYQSLAEVKVAKGAEIKKGDIIAKAGRNELEKDEGYHVHFEVRQDGNAVNPAQYLTDK